MRKEGLPLLVDTNLAGNMRGDRSDKSARCYPGQDTYIENHDHTSLHNINRMPSHHHATFSSHEPRIHMSVGSRRSAFHRTTFHGCTDDKQPALSSISLHRRPPQTLRLIRRDDMVHLE